MLSACLCRWRQAEDGTWSGVVGDHIVSLRQTTQDVLFRIHPSTPKPQPPPPPKKRKARQPLSSCKVEAAADSHTSPCISDADRARVISELREFLNMDAASLSELYKGFSAADSRFAALSAHLGGARMLRQDPLECLFSFICSSNNHISRITGEGFETDFGSLDRNEPGVWGILSIWPSVGAAGHTAECVTRFRIPQV
jgi:N-glycosylase/DNA lyase